MKKEPVAIITAITTAIELGLIMAMTYGLKLTEEQLTATMGFIVAIAGIVSVFFTRQQVTPNAKVKEIH